MPSRRREEVVVILLRKGYEKTTGVTLRNRVGKKVVPNLLNNRIIIVEVLRRKV